ncbi:MAG TPA: hypothetical protein PKW90_08480, partial [Myxococcota bacterium]|nr:hypothetical protein [Myxococcota bacterium]
MRVPTLFKFLLSLLLFWGWNSFFGTFALMSLTILFQAGLPTDIALSLGLVAVVPTISMGLGLWKIRDPDWQLRWLFGVEAPLVLLAVLRLGLVRELTVPGLAWFLALGVGLGFYALHLRRGLSAATGI